MNSMTGYGEATERRPDFSVYVRISSVNRKHFDIRLTLSRDLAFMEPDIRTRLRDDIQRGHLSVVVELKTGQEASNSQPRADVHLARLYLQEIQSLQSAVGVTGELTVKDLIGLPDVLKVKPREFAEDDLRAATVKAMGEALAAFQSMRASEGGTLRDDLAERRDLLAAHLTAIRALAPSQPDQYRERLNQRLHDLTDGLAIDADRVAKEVAIYAERCDITEEMVRLESHLDQLHSLLATDEPVGRKLDFLMQEVNREINTIGSKSVDREISQRVIDMKTELDRMREQAQNIE